MLEHHHRRVGMLKYLKITSELNIKEPFKTQKHLLEIKEIYMLRVLINDCHISLGNEYCLDHLLMLNHHLISYFLSGMYNFRGLYKTHKCRVIIHLKFAMFDCIETLIFFICC